LLYHRFIVLDIRDDVTTKMVRKSQPGDAGGLPGALRALDFSHRLCTTKNTEVVDYLFIYTTETCL
jgi:hypothetical protein